MVGKNNQYVKKIKQGTKVETYSIKKFKVGIASVAIGCSVFFGAGAVAMAGEQTGASVLTGESNTTVVPKGEERAITGNQSATGAQSNSTPAKEGKIEPEKPKATVNKAKLETLIKEVEGLNLEKYTEESVKVLKTELAKAKEVFETAQNKEEVEAAWRTLFTYKNSKLVVKKTPKLSQDNTPKPDTTNGKETVGINAENTEPNGTNIAGHNHSMNGTTRSEGSGFRATPEEVSGVEFGISNGQRDGNYSRTDRYFDTLSSNQYTRIFKFVSKSGNITSVTATSSTGRSVTLEKMDKFPNNATTYFVKAKTDVTGVSDAILSFTVKTAGGDKTAQIGVYRSLGKPTIKVPTGQKESTVDEYLKGKQKTTPTIDVEVPVVPNLPSYAKMKVYLVHDNDRDKGVYDGDEWAENHNPRPTRLTAKVEVPYGRVDPKTNKTTVTIQSGDYLKPLAEGKYFVLSVIEINNEMNTNPGIRASSFSDAATVASKEVNKDALRTATTTDVTATKAKPEYYNAEASQKTAYDNAVESGKTIFNKADATQTEVNDAVTAINNAKNALRGVATNKAALQTATTTDVTATKAKPEYYNAEASQKTAYDNAVESGKTIFNKADATQTEVNDAVTAINNAKNALRGVATNKDALRTATTTGDTETKATAAYYNAEASKKDAYDRAVTAGKEVLAKDNATQTEINNALSAITNAKNALGGVATNKDALRTATSTGDTETKATAEYYNAEASKKTAYDQAVTAGKVVLAKDNATQTEVNDAVNAINAVKEKLDGAPFPTEIEKSNAIEEVKKALDTKVKSIESSKEFTDNDKGILKDKAEKAAMTAIVKIKTATTNAAVETAKTEGIERINSVEARLAAKLEVPELIITKWQDEAGNDLRPADAKVPSELGEANEALAHGEIPGYEYVVTKTYKENVVVTHIFRKLPKKDHTFLEKPKTSNPNKADESQSPAKENVSMKSNLPNTGVTGTNSGLAGLGLAVFGGLLTVARQRRRNK